jgi:hypothetical protein
MIRVRIAMIYPCANRSPNAVSEAVWWRAARHELLFLALNGEPDSGSVHYRRKSQQKNSGVK